MKKSKRSKKVKRRSNVKRSSNKKSSKCLSLVKLVKSPNKEKKYRAIFNDGSHTDFGAKGYSDYTIHKDYNRMKRYDSRHRRREDWNNMKSRGALSKWILWNKPSLKGSIADYRKRLRSKCRK
jgi:hypothetical protein